MTTTHRITGALSLIAVAALLTTAVQNRQLAALRLQEQDLQAKATRRSPPASRATANLPAPVAAPAAAPLTEAEKLELLRLRSQITQLRARQRELASVRPQRLPTDVRATGNVTVTASNVVAIPAGYVRRAEAQNVGLATPASALQSLLWAISHRDTNVFFQVLTPESAERTRQELEQKGEAFFDGSEKIPGFVVRDQTPQPDGSVELSVEVIPGEDPTAQKIKARLVGGLWRIDM